MLYVRGRFLFIHIPRTSGTSITSTLAGHFLSEMPWEDMVVSTWAFPSLDQHSTAMMLKPLIPDYDDVFKFAVYRDRNEIIESDYRLHKHLLGALDPNTDQAFADSVRRVADETLDQFTERRWNPWIGELDPWTYWTGNDPSIHRYEFSDLQNEWGRLLRDIGLPPIELGHFAASQNIDEE